MKCTAMRQIHVSISAVLVFTDAHAHAENKRFM